MAFGLYGYEIRVGLCPTLRAFCNPLFYCRHNYAADCASCVKTAHTVGCEPKKTRGLRVIEHFNLPWIIRGGYAVFFSRDRIIIYCYQPDIYQFNFRDVVKATDQYIDGSEFVYLFSRYPAGRLPPVANQLCYPARFNIAIGLNVELFNFGALFFKTVVG